MYLFPSSSLVSIVDILTLLHPLIIDKEIDVYNRIDVLVVIEQVCMRNCVM